MKKKQQKPINYRPDLERYNKELAQWRASNPNATEEQVRDAKRAIAARCGI